MTRVFGLVLVFALSACGVRRPLAEAQPGHDQEELLFRRFALSRCVAHAYPEPEVREDALDVAGAYLERGELGLDAYEAADALGKAFLKRALPSKSGAELRLMKCIELSESEALLEIYRGARPSQ